MLALLAHNLQRCPGNSTREISPEQQKVVLCPQKHLKINSHVTAMQQLRHAEQKKEWVGLKAQQGRGRGIH